jgi:crotonobetainyl-CoA:carnitine CoA-transferase CaiB-like acyl-CoA transferase
MSTGPFVGVRILDLSQYLAGPFAASKLGDLGADVIKIERPGSGEAGRVAAAGGVRLAGESPTFLALNRSKRGLAVDMKAPEGVDVVRRLAERSDVLIENFRPGVMERLGLGYESLSKVNPRLIYVRASGYGRTGPLSEKPGQDLLVQSIAGLASATGRNGDPPIPCGAPVADVTMAHQISFAVAAALYARERSGRGQCVDVNLLDGLLDLQAHFFAVVLNSDRDSVRSSTGISDPYLAAPYGVYRTSDGYLAIAHTPMEKLATLLETPSLAAYVTLEERFSKRDEIYDLVQAVIQSRSTNEWLAILEPHDIWCAPVQNHRAIAAHPQVTHNDMIVRVDHPTAGPLRLTGIPIKFSETPGVVSCAAPLLGQHTAEILKELGMDADTVQRLEVAGVVDCGDRSLQAESGQSR